MGCGTYGAISEANVINKSAKAVTNYLQDHVLSEAGVDFRACGEIC